MSLVGSPELLVRHYSKKLGKLVAPKEVVKAACWVATEGESVSLHVLVIHCSILPYVCGKRVSIIHDYVQLKALMIISIVVGIHATIWGDL